MKRILIANRGEIAVRVIRTCRQLGIETVAVYSEADAAHPHVKLADFSFLLGAAPAKDSYLNIPKILEIAARSGADAIHPGYGFLSENLEFVRACKKARLTFIGPSEKTMAGLGNKDAAREIAQKVGVPTIPGYNGGKQDLTSVRSAAQKLGYPVLLKARAGGGGKGMRLVEAGDQLEQALASARREAETFFADPNVIVEKVIDQPRHIEVQLIGDSFGNLIHLYERDCTLQRRHQKVIEESPSPILTEALRTEITRAALSLGKACELSNATTFEFLVDSNQNYYFLEANCRIQVEHPVTELVTGIDLVELQIRVARGERLPFGQEGVRLRGSAIESRVYAESPEKGFIPRPGTVTDLRLPAENPYLRVDHGLANGVTISTHYDAMVAKVICWGENRGLALARSISALKQFEAYPLENNQQFLINLLQHDAVISNGIDTTFIDRKLHELIKPPRVDLSSAEASVVAGAYRLVQLFQAGARHREDPFSRLAKQFNEVPQQTYRMPRTNWRIQDSVRGTDIVHQVELQQMHLTSSGCEFQWTVDQQPIRLRMEVSPETATVGETAGSANSGNIVVELAERRITLHLSRQRGTEGHGFNVATPAVRYLATIHHTAKGLTTGVEQSSVVASPLPGKLLAVRVKPGNTVSAGSVVAVIESMKMEHTLQAPTAGRIAEILVKAGANVREGEVIATLEPSK